MTNTFDLELKFTSQICAIHKCAKIFTAKRMTCKPLNAIIRAPFEVLNPYTKQLLKNDNVCNLDKQINKQLIYAFKIKMLINHEVHFIIFK